LFQQRSLAHFVPVDEKVVHKTALLTNVLPCLFFRTNNIRFRATVVTVNIKGLASLRAGATQTKDSRNLPIIIK
jgi:hypothetical protein